MVGQGVFGAPTAATAQSHIPPQSPLEMAWPATLVGGGGLVSPAASASAVDGAAGNTGSYVPWLAKHEGWKWAFRQQGELQHTQVVGSSREHGEQQHAQMTGSPWQQHEQQDSQAAGSPILAQSHRGAPNSWAADRGAPNSWAVDPRLETDAESAAAASGGGRLDAATLVGHGGSVTARVPGSSSLAEPTLARKLFSFSYQNRVEEPDDRLLLHSSTQGSPSSTQPSPSIYHTPAHGDRLPHAAYHTPDGRLPHASTRRSPTTEEPAHDDRGSGRARLRRPGPDGLPARGCRASMQTRAGMRKGIYGARRLRPPEQTRARIKTRASWGQIQVDWRRRA